MDVDLNQDKETTGAFYTFTSHQSSAFSGSQQAALDELDASLERLRKAQMLPPQTSSYQSTDSPDARTN